MPENNALAVIQRKMKRTLRESPEAAFETFVGEDPLDLRTRAALVADDDGFLLDPADAADDGYVVLERDPRSLEDVERWLRDVFPGLVVELARDAPSPRLVAAMVGALGLEEPSVARWIVAFRDYPVHDRREVLALLRSGSKRFRELYPGAILHPGRDGLRVSRAYATLCELTATATRS